MKPQAQGINREGGWKFTLPLSNRILIPTKHLSAHNQNQSESKPLQRRERVRIALTVLPAQNGHRDLSARMRHFE